MIGAIDGFEGGYLTGWALTPLENKSSSIVVKSADGRAVSRGVAARHRADLKSLGFGQDNFAFRIPIKLSKQKRSLRVYADETELPQSPVEVGPGLFDGHISIAGPRVSGWVTERVNDFTAPRITLVDQFGVMICEHDSNVDYTASDPFFRPARFSFFLPDHCFGRDEIVIHALAAGVEFAKARCRLALEGYLDSLSADHCCGWLFSPDDPTRSFRLDVFRDGALIKSGFCRVPRPDLTALFPTVGDAGFDMRLPQDAFAVSYHGSAVSIRFPGSDRDLLGGPFVVATKAAAVAALRRLARMARLSEMMPLSDRTVLMTAIERSLDGVRRGPEYISSPTKSLSRTAGADHRLTIIIPVYRGVSVTLACIDSVIDNYCPKRDRVIIINDCSPEKDMTIALRRYDGIENIEIIENEENLGFVRTVNRGLESCPTGDVLLLNSDTRVFSGAFDELLSIGRSSSDIGTVTALSSNATIFTYPHPKMPQSTLDDISWSDVARIALLRNRGNSIEVPTGHGFCLLITEAMLRNVRKLDEGFGRGYGEENDMCQRGADLGFRHVAAAGVLVEHRESTSFGHEERERLLRRNIPILEAAYPEYTQTIMSYERVDGLRSARWPIDLERIRAFRRRGHFAVVVRHALGGGTDKAIADFEEHIGYGASAIVTLTPSDDGVTLECRQPLIRAFFLHDEVKPLEIILNAMNARLMVVHQILGFSYQAISMICRYAKERHSIAYIHDFYAICPRVNLLDAVDQFCGVGSDDRCDRCVRVGGPHPNSTLVGIRTSEHRALMGEFLDSVKIAVSPSHSTAQYICKIFPNVKIAVVPHYEPIPSRVEDLATTAPIKAPTVAVIGAIGPHKGSRRLLDLARRALLSHPDLEFVVIGYTDIDDEFAKLPNVRITGRYKADDLPRLVKESRAQIALFLHEWPETFSYTLSEAVSLGLHPIVPDIGAPAERLAAAGFGTVVSFPIDMPKLLDLIDQLRTQGPVGLADHQRFVESRQVSDVAAALGIAGSEPRQPLIESVT